VESLIDKIIWLDTIQIQEERYSARKKYNQRGMYEYVIIQSHVTKPRHETHGCFKNPDIRETR